MKIWWRIAKELWFDNTNSYTNFVVKSNNNVLQQYKHGLQSPLTTRHARDQLRIFRTRTNLFKSFGERYHLKASHCFYKLFVLFNDNLHSEACCLRDPNSMWFRISGYTGSLDDISKYFTMCYYLKLKFYKWKWY